MSETPEKKRLVYVMTTYLRQHGLMSFISLNIPEREINLHFVNSAGLQQNAPFCVLLKKHFIFSWFYHTIFKVLTTQILYPKCSILRPSEKKRPLLLPFLVSRGLACMPTNPIKKGLVSGNRGRAPAPIQNLLQGRLLQFVWKSTSIN